MVGNSNTVVTNCVSTHKEGEVKCGINDKKNKIECQEKNAYCKWSLQVRSSPGLRQRMNVTDPECLGCI